MPPCWEPVPSVVASSRAKHKHEARPCVRELAEEQFLKLLHDPRQVPQNTFPGLSSSGFIPGQSHLRLLEVLSVRRLHDSGRACKAGGALVAGGLLSSYRAPPGIKLPVLPMEAMHGCSITRLQPMCSLADEPVRHEPQPVLEQMHGGWLQRLCGEGLVARLDVDFCRRPRSPCERVPQQGAWLSSGPAFRVVPRSLANRCEDSAAARALIEQGVDLTELEPKLQPSWERPAMEVL